MSKTVKENLIAAKALIDTPEKWAKNSSTHTECRCAALACEKLRRDTDDYAMDVDEMWDALHSALPANWQTDGRETGIAIGKFNDHPDTTHADIMALFDRAIAAQDASP